MSLQRKIFCATIIIGIVTLASMWIIPMIFNKSKTVGLDTINLKGDNSQNIGKVQTGDRSPVIQTGDNSMVQISYYGSEEVDKLKEEIAKLKVSKVPFPDRPNVVIVNPSVTFTNWEDGSIVYGEVVNGCVTAGLDIKFLNIGGIEAKNITTKWTILDNDNRITGLNEWLTEFLRRDPLVIKTLLSNQIVSIKYGPHIGASGEGTLKLTLDYQYTNAATGEIYSGQYKGFVDYKTIKNNQPKLYLFSPIDIY